MLTLNDGRAELWQWDTGRTLAVDADCSQVHFSNKVFGRSIDVDVVDGAAIIPDILLQTDKDLNVWAFAGTAENGYTKISKTFKVNRRNKPADYVFTPPDQMTLQMIQRQIGDLTDLTTEAKDTLVAAINEAARTGGGAGSMELRVADGYVQYSADGGMTWANLIAMADLKGDPGEPGKDGHSPVVTATKSGKTTTISVDGEAIATVDDGADGKPGAAGADGITPHISDNGNWYIGDTDTGKPSRGAAGAPGAPGTPGKDGSDGHTPVKGTDYWTASDKAEVVAEAAAAIDLTPYAKKTEVPTKTSQITNDSGFLTSHQDISGKQDKATLEADVAANGFTKNTGTYSKPSGGIPKSDLAEAVQTSLRKADTALQSHQSLAAYRTAAAQDVIDSGKVAKVDGKGLSTNDYTDAAKAKVDAIPAVDSTLTVSGAAADANETGTRLNTLSGKIDNFIASGGFSAPIVDSVDEMVDTNKQYILKSTGTIWEWKETTTEKEVTVRNDITSGYERGRLSSGGANAGDVQTHTLTPLIDITKAEYQGKTIQIHLDGNRYFSETSEVYIMTALFNPSKATILGRAYSTLDRNAGVLGTLDNAGATATIHNTTSATLTIPVPLVDDSGNTVGYLRFCGLGTVDGTVYITYTENQTVTEETWTDTGVAFGGGGSIDTETLAKIAELNNEGTDPTTIKLLAKPVLDFYNASAYSDNDYTYSHLSNITYPCRADIPVPFNVKWNHNEDAMRTTVAVDTKAIGTLNAYTMITYDATGLDNFPIYNLLPNKTYYYKVTHVLADGSLAEAKSGSFTTSSEAWRLLYIDGTQNVRDLGGWTGLNGKTVKYGKIIRGAAFSDSSFPGLMLTGKGRLALGELKIQAELNLGAIDSATSIAANVAYKKIGYTNYAIAFTGEAYRAQFKEVLEWIVDCLTASKPVYMHCQGGCDRTGTLAFQLLGLLGVSESDLAKEYELSSFSNIGFGRLRTTTKAVDTYDYVGMVEALKAYSGDTITDKFYNFATTGCSISADTITNFRNLMLE